VVEDQELPIGFLRKQLTTSAITQNGNQMTVHELSDKDGQHRAFIALGSNMGDRLEMIERACKLLDQSGEVSILRTSSLWETKAMYVENQADFLNGVCEVKTLSSFE
jgi:peroxiredoxin